MEPRFDFLKLNLTVVHIVIIPTILVLSEARLFFDDQYEKKAEALESTNGQPYGFPSPFTLPPLQSSSPMQSPPSTPDSYMLSPPPSLTFPFNSPPESPASMSFSPPIYTPPPTPSQLNPSSPNFPFYSPPKSPTSKSFSPPIYTPMPSSNPSNPSSPNFPIESPPKNPANRSFSPPMYTPMPSPSPPNRPGAHPPPPNKRPVYAVWCVAKPTVPELMIQEALDYACGSGADCKSIQPNGPCFQPNTLVLHASYAFNSYWQNTKAGGGTCDFGGTAMLVTADPSFDNCNFIFK